MTDPKNKGGDIMSGAELLSINFPEHKYYWAEFLRNQGKLAIISKEKRAKSFFGMHLGISISNGADFLGYKTETGIVLYINFEISIEKLQERMQDLQAETGLDYTNFYTKTMPEGLAIDTEKGRDELGSILKQCKNNGYPISVLILDPRRQSMIGDENQSEILNRWCLNLNKLQAEFGFALVVIHHQGKNTGGAGRGSSVFDGWLTSILEIKPKGNDLSLVKIEIIGRDFEATDMETRFKYPKWQVSKQDLQQRKTAVSNAITIISNHLKAQKQVLQTDLRNYVYKQGVSNYAYKEAKKELQSNRFLEVVDAKGVAGHNKIVRLLKP